MKEIGVVKHFSTKWGRGVITREDGLDIPVSVHAILTNGFKMRVLKPGQQVEFKMGDGPDAAEVEIL